jgi:cell division protein FtsQ
MYYRGSRVPLSERARGFSKAGVREGRRSFGSAKKDGKALFAWWGKKENRREAASEAKAYAFYRPGVTPAEGTPGFSKKEGAWRLKAPALGGLKWALKLAGLVLLAGAVAWSKNRTTALLQDVAGLKLEKVAVEGNKYLEEDEVVQAAALPLGESMFKLDLKAATQRVERLDWVKRVFIERRLPRTILISVRERTPVALLDNGSLYGLDGEGRILSPSPALLQRDLPLVSGVSFPADAVGTTLQAQALEPALDFLAFLGKKDPALAQDVSEVNLSDPEGLQVTFIDGIQATFNPPVSETDLDRMALVLSDLNGKGKRAATLDFRYRDMVVVKTRGGG